jgi:hypothetical protein
MPKIIDIKPPKKEVEREKEKTEKIVYLPPKKGIKKGLIFLIIVLLFIFAFFLLNYFSFAKIEIKLATTDFNFEKELTVDTQVKSLDFSKDVLPGQRVEFEKTISQEFSATGKLKKEKKAEGVVRIFNKSNLNQTLVINTRLQPPSENFLAPLDEKNGERPYFLTTERIIIPAGGWRDVKVIAHSPGEKYNIGPSKFSIPGLAGTPQYTLVYGESSQPMSGGFKGEALVVTADDLKKAKDSLAEKVREEGEKLIKENISQSYIFLDGVSKTDILGETFSATSGQEVEKFNCQLKIKAKGLVFLKKDFEDFIKNYILSSNPDKEIWQEKLLIETKMKNFDIDSGKIFFTANVKSKIYKKIDETSLKKQIAKNSLQEVKIYLKEQPAIEEFKINIFPFWVKNLPENLDKINLEIRLD